jgi:hypothetical protein
MQLLFLPVSGQEICLSDKSVVNFLQKKLTLCLINQAPCHDDIQGSGGITPPFLTLLLDGGEWSVPCPGRFIPCEIVPGTHWIRGWVGPRASLDIVDKRKSCSCQVSNPGCLPCSPSLYQLRYPDSIQSSTAMCLYFCQGEVLNNRVLR